MDSDTGGSGGVLSGQSVRRKLLAGFVVVSLLTVAVGAAGVYGVRATSATADEIANRDTEQVDGSMMLKLEAQRERASVYRFVRGEDGAREEFQGAVDKWNRVFEERFAALGGLSDEQRRLLDRAADQHEAAVAAAEDVMAARMDGDTTS